MTIPLARRLDFNKIALSDIAGTLIIGLVAQLQALLPLRQASGQTLLLDQRMCSYLPRYYRGCGSEDRAGSSKQEGCCIGHDTVVDPGRPLTDNGSTSLERFAYGRYRAGMSRQTFPDRQVLTISA